ncbi:delta-60 repeat domain-containing protein [Kineosporia sp. A_224]|uniref:delta-60 repeat domain-containing protein n=1 Tax=Kineosporia sp. A_224 TaxID=1962180 RepID=UPI0013040301|nr:delta-60 repeat domain-containing protein [Kineosporia sp. A_224]
METALDVLVQADGKIVVVGSSGADAALVRYLPNGALDTTFSGDGKQKTNFGGSTDAIKAVVQQPDGKLVTAGTTGSQAVVARYTAAGVLDTTFSGDGWAVETPSAGVIVDNSAEDVLVQADGSIAAVGPFHVSRWTSTGAPSALLPSGQNFDGGEGYRRIARLSTGDYVIAGSSDCNSAVVSRITAAGAFDLGFAANTGAFVGVRAVGLSVLAGDKVAVVSDGWQSSECTRSPGVVLERYLADGHHDSTFGTAGAKVVDTGAWPTGAKGVAATGASVMPDGRIVVVGQTWVARFTASGTLDTTFSGDGVALVGTPVGAAVAVQPDANPVVGATSSGNVAAVRFLGSTSVTAYPTSVAVSAGNGTITGGTANSLAATDGAFLTAASTTSGTRTASWYGGFSNVPNAVAAISVSYTGKDSTTVTQTVDLWDYDAAAWVQLDSRSVGTLGVTVTASAGGTLGRFVSGTSGNGAMRLRIRGTAASTFTVSGDRMAVTYR